MTDIKRYSLSDNATCTCGNIDFIAEMEENDTGEYVTFADHIAKIEQLKQTHQAQVSRQHAIIEELRQELRKYGYNFS